MHPTFHPTLVFSMLDEMLDVFDQGFTVLTHPWEGTEMHKSSNDIYMSNFSLQIALSTNRFRMANGWRIDDLDRDVQLVTDLSNLHGLGAEFLEGQQVYDMS